MSSNQEYKRRRAATKRHNRKLRKQLNVLTYPENFEEFRGQVYCCVEHGMINIKVELYYYTDESVELFRKAYREGACLIDVLHNKLIRK